MDIRNDQTYKTEPDWLIQLKKRKSVIMNTLIIAVNIVVFILVELTGSSLDSRHLIEWGAAYTPFIQQGGEYYRLFTCMFLHFGLSHLGNNMLVLVFLGDSLERAAGKIRYLVIYLIGGLGASFLSYHFSLEKGEAVVAAGASGAVFAVIGAMLYVLIANRGRLEDLTTGKLVFLTVLSLYHGVVSTGVDNTAHIGGFLCGLFLGMLLYRKKEDIRQ